MAKTKTISFTKAQVEMLVYELKCGVRGDGDSYDTRLKKLIKKVEEAEWGKS